MVRGQVKDSKWKDAQAAPLPPEFDQPPSYLDGDEEAQREWARIVPIVRAGGYVSATEQQCMVALCQQWSLYLQGLQGAREHGLTEVGNGGKEAPSPYLLIANNALKECRQLWAELGLTPSGRARMHKGPGAATDPPSKWAGLIP